MRELIDLTRLPEWSAFFGAAMRHNRLHFKWRAEGQEWIAEAYELRDDPVTKGPTTAISEARSPDKFEVLSLALQRSGKNIHPAVWDALTAFREAANGGAGSIEDLL